MLSGMHFTVSCGSACLCGATGVRLTHNPASARQLDFLVFPPGVRLAHNLASARQLAFTLSVKSKLKACESYFRAHPHATATPISTPSKSSRPSQFLSVACDLLISPNSHAFPKNQKISKACDLRFFRKSHAKTSKSKRARTEMQTLTSYHAYISAIIPPAKVTVATSNSKL